MSRNGSGTYSLYTPGNPVVNGTTIDATAFNNTMDDIATALTGSVASNGETTISAPIKFTQGTAGSPALTYSGATNQGIYFPSPSSVAVTVGGNQQCLWESGKVSFGGTFSGTSRLTTTGASDTSSDYAYIAQNASKDTMLSVRNDKLVTINGLSATWTTGSSANVYTNPASGDMYRSTSALKYKTDIRDLEYIDINKFRPVRYKSKCATDNPDRDYFGFIADDVVNSGINELVSFGADGEVENFEYDRMTAVLCKAVQDLSNRVKQLEEASK